MNYNNKNYDFDHASIIVKTKRGFKRLTKVGKITVIALILLIIFIFTYGFNNYMRKISTYKISLNGMKVINLYEGGVFIEPGFTAYNYKKKDSTSKVIVKNKVDFDTVGTYEIEYSINNFWKKNVITRKINILKNPIDDIEFSLIGKEDVVVKLGNEYKELGYKLSNDDKKDYSEYVKVESNVNNAKLGEYEVKYTLKINKKKKELVRKVYVTGDRYTISYNKKATNDNIDLKLLSNINDFSYFIINDKKVYKDIANCVIKENGKYNFKMVNKSGRIDNINVVITNIDREAPTGTCIAYKYKKDNKTVFNLDVKDNNKLKNLKYNNETFEEMTYTYNSFVDDGIVYAYDEAGNVGEISCLYYYGPIVPSESSKIVKDFDSESLKYWVERFPTYYVTHIWVSDAYNQFKVGVKEPFPTISTASSIMNYVSKTNEYYDKAMIGANGSSFVSDVFYAMLAQKMPEWKYSSISSVVMVDGNIKRNFTSINIPKIGVMTYGLKSNGYFDYYNLNHSNDITSNILELDRLINDGVRYTFSFYPVLIHNGNIQYGLGVDNNIRQAIGQVDENNFVIITNSTTKRSLGFNFSSLANLMKKLDCIEAYNLDGGGSTNLVYKDEGTNSSKNLIYTYRNIADIIYFVEK